ncbi:MAG TPA: efflux RND transporter periplasmic adaptor subunit, partial [Verrucomicrobiae bacterium]
LAGTSGWFAAKHTTSTGSANQTASGRKILFYQSPMHPWIKSDKPGKCTICGMDLVPVYEGEKALDVAPGTVVLSSNTINVIHVQTSEVKRQPLRRTLNVAGTIDDNDTRHRILSAYVDGRIDKLYVNYIGGEVTEGQPLATFYSTALLNAEHEYANLVKKVISTQSDDLRKVNRELLEATGQRLRQLGLTENQIRELANRDSADIHTEIVAPMSGTVVSRNVYEGQYVKEGDRLFEIADFSVMWFLFDAYENDLSWLRLGQKVELTTPAQPGKTYMGTIAFIDPNIKEMTRSAKVRVEIANPLVEITGRKQRELYHKLYAQGTVQVATPELLTVPRSAVLAPGAQAFVYVDKGAGAYEQRLVKLGRAGDDVWEVLEGLTAGDQVVTTGNLLIDSQAQLNASANMQEEMEVRGSGETNNPTGKLAAPLNGAQKQSLQELLRMADELGQALAADNVQEFKTRAANLEKAAVSAKQQFSSLPDWAALIDKAEAAAHFPEIPDLAAARKVFLPFSMASVELAQRVRVLDREFRTLKIFKCPMVNQAVPGAAKTGYWLQTSASLRNPFFGAEMLDCGSEVK